MLSDSKRILYTVATSILTLHEVYNKSVTTLKYISKWFSGNGLSLNMGKTKIIKFYLSHSQYAVFQISYRDRCIKNDTNIKFFGMQIDKHMNWKTHRTDNSKIKQCMLCSWMYVSSHQYWFTSNDMLCLFPLNKDIWHNILGFLNKCRKGIQVTQESSKNYDGWIPEICADQFSKNWKSWQYEHNVYYH
jgi:hypothetical protein